MRTSGELSRGLVICSPWGALEGALVVACVLGMGAAWSLSLLGIGVSAPVGVFEMP